MSQPRVLVVDDSSVLRLQMRRMLSQAGYEVDLAANGLEAIRHMQSEVPQLVILDIQMPGMDGYEVSEQMKQMGTPWDRLPIIFVTSVNSNALRLLGTAMGAYLTKPVRSSELLAKVGQLIAAPRLLVREEMCDELLADTCPGG